MSNYYVYVLIDPRNFEEFYFGKGTGSRKYSHCFDQSDTAKTKRIKEIQHEKLEPIIRVIATNLTEPEALLIEKTLLWKLGKWTTNISSGHFAEKFRPLNTLHKEIPNFDYQNGLYYYNIGGDEIRNWDDYREYGIISAGQGPKWRDPMLNFKEGDVFVAYLKGKGFVGIGRIKTKAKMVNHIQIGGIPLLSLKLRGKLGTNSSSVDDSEYVCLVEWINSVSREEAKWKSKSNLYTTTHVRASLEGQPNTIDFIDSEFYVNLRDLIK